MTTTSFEMKGQFPASVPSEVRAAIMAEIDENIQKHCIKGAESLVDYRSEMCDADGDTIVMAFYNGAIIDAIPSGILGYTLTALKGRCTGVNVDLVNGRTGTVIHEAIL